VNGKLLPILSQATALCSVRTSIKDLGLLRSRGLAAWKQDRVATLELFELKLYHSTVHKSEVLPFPLTEKYTYFKGREREAKCVLFKAS